MGDGYYHTGDVAARDAEGYLTIEHPAVAEAAVVPSPCGGSRRRVPPTLRGASWSFWEEDLRAHL